MTDYNLRIKLLRTLSAFIPLLEERELVIVDDKGIGQASVDSSLKVYDPNNTDIKQLYKTMKKVAKFTIEQPQNIQEGTTYLDKTDYTLKRYNGIDWEIIGRTTIDFDNNLGGAWTKCINIPILTPPSEDIQYKIEINGDNILVYSNDGTTVLTSGNGGLDFWSNVQSDGKDIRICNENYEQNYFWIEKFDYTNQQVIIWVKLNTGQKAVNIVYGNTSCLESTYNDANSVFVRVISNLIGCWHFDEGIGTTTHDFSGQAHNGTLNGSVSWTTNGYYGNALSFSGGYVEMANSTNMDGYSQLTIIGRIYPTESTSYGEIIFNKETCYELAITNNTIEWAVQNASRWDWVNTGIKLNLNTWYTIAWVYENASSIKTYVYDSNGNLRTHTGSFGSGNIATSSYSLRIGDRSAVSTPFKGSIDEVYMFDRALTQEEIDDIQKNLCRGSNNGNLLVGYKVLSSDLSFGTPTIKTL